MCVWSNVSVWTGLFVLLGPTVLKQNQNRRHNHLYYHTEVFLVKDGVLRLSVKLDFCQIYLLIDTKQFWAMSYNNVLISCLLHYVLSLSQYQISISIWLTVHHSNLHHLRLPLLTLFFKVKSRLSFVLEQVSYLSFSMVFLLLLKNKLRRVFLLIHAIIPTHNRHRNATRIPTITLLPSANTQTRIWAKKWIKTQIFLKFVF